MCRYCDNEIPAVEFSIGGTSRYYQPPTCSCPAAQAVLERRIQENEIAEWRSNALAILNRSVLSQPRYTDMRFKNWDDSRHSGQAEMWRGMVEQYVDSVSLKADNWLILNGPYGAGKTHLAVAAIRKIAAQNLWKPHIIVWPEINASTRERWGTGSGFESSEWDKARTCAILLIDDLDKTKTDQHSMEKLYTVVNARYDRKLPTIITMNATLEGLKAEWLSSTQFHLADTGAAVIDRIEGQLVAEIPLVGSSQRTV